jgi:2-C-methyl-D-erythritol 4-phosphate cytidylyltransferase
VGDRTIALVPAAGRGQRMGTSTPKQFLMIGGLPVLVHALRVLEDASAVTEIILAVPEQDREFCHAEIITRHGFKKISQVVSGGVQRQDSVRHALEAMPANAHIALVHDAVRPFITVEMINRVITAAAKTGGAIVAIPMRDTVKQVDREGVIHTTVDRGQLWLAQTPQAFRATLLQEAHRKAMVDGFQGTDEAQLVERLGQPVAIVEGSTENIKITRPEDLAIGEAILMARSRQNVNRDS